MSVKITSTDNKIIKKAVRLNASSAFRNKEKLFMIEGLRLCLDAALSDVRVCDVFFTPDFSCRHKSDLDFICEKADGNCYEIGDNVSEKLADTKNPQGIFLICEMKSCTENLLQKTKYIALENISDPANLGTIIRSAEAFGLDGIILSGDCCDIYNAKVLRGSMGGVFRLPMILPWDFYSFLNTAKNDNFTVVATTPKRGAKPVFELDRQKKLICLIGNEGNGLTDKAFSVADDKITIPMRGRGESLNAGVAASVIIYEITR